MALHLHWFLPSHSDGRDIGWRPRAGHASARAARRDPDIGYLTQVALAADRLGFESVLTPTGLFCEDAWLTAAVLARETERLRFMVALRPGVTVPTAVAQMAATFQRLSGGRLMFNIVAGGDPDELRRYGDWLDHDARFARAEEFLTVLRGVWRGEPFSFTGEHYQVAEALLAKPADVEPTIFVGGSSPAAQSVALSQGDVYLAWGESPPQLGELIAGVRERAAAKGARLSCGTRFHVIARDTEREAWAEADRLVAGMDPAKVEAARARFARSESEGQRRMAAMSARADDRMEVHPNVWAGYAMLRPGAGAALVGSHEQVAERIAELHALGVDHLLLSGQPHLEEAYWFGEGVLPLLKADGILA